MNIITKRDAAVEIMFRLGIYEKYIRLFREKGAVCLYRNGLGTALDETNNPVFSEKIKSLEEDYDVLVYAVVQSIAWDGVFVYFLTVGLNGDSSCDLEEEISKISGTGMANSFFNILGWDRMCYRPVPIECRLGGFVIADRHDTVLVSIRPEYCDAIRSGKKIYEYRRTVPKNEITGMLIYETAPVKAVVGYADIERILVDAPEELWNRTKGGAGISKEFFDEYFQGCDRAYAYALKNAEFYAKPITLAEKGIKAAPQSWAYVKMV